ncbi:MAG TPA: hypothetical protein PLV92_23750, partial [Pirellulaceae bacterium]|nr:hypothetical protein [Pirellulaceae bacterium]
DAHLRHVETYLQIAREEVDCRDAFERARQHLKRAERAVERMPAQQSDPRLRTALQHQITELSLRIAAGEQSASRYFFGAFPWATCLVSSTMPRDATVGRQVELFDDPAAVAVRTAIARQIAAMEASDHEQPQVDFLVFGDPPDAQLEFEATTVYAGHDLFRPYDARRLLEAGLSKSDWSTIRQLAPSSETIAKLVAGASSGRVMLTRITPIDQIDGRHRYEVTAHVYVDGESTAAMTMSFTGTCRDQRSAAILAFAQRVAQHFDAESTGTEGESGQAAWRQPAESNYPISTFLAQHIAQERLNEGLTLDPYAGATGAYARSGQLAASGAAAGLDIAV